jgi:Cytochrome c554 and c-prime
MPAVMSTSGYVEMFVARVLLICAVWLAYPMPGVLGAGPSDCAECHGDLTKRQSVSAHARTLSPYPASRLAQLFSSSNNENGGFRYEYQGSTVTVRRNTERVTGTLEWAFGAGSQGLTPVGRYDGIFYEHRLSYYAVPGKSALTPGHSGAAPRSAAEAIGLLKLPQDIYRCFDCHSTGLKQDIDGGPDFSGMTPGVACERCHGPGQSHVQAARAGRPSPEIVKATFNAGRLPAKALVEVCGACHRLPEPGKFSVKPEVDDPVSVRFQPVGLMASRCFRESGKLSCVSCHDPHQDAKHDPAFYIGKCLGCHESSTAQTIQCRRRAREDCAACHMRKATPLRYLTFTDHRIRVYP